VFAIRGNTLVRGRQKFARCHTAGPGTLCIKIGGEGPGLNVGIRIVLDIRAMFSRNFSVAWLVSRKLFT